ncbi:uncharacterized protein LOC126741614 [Anthonomus grandis grandis]|uniref:uncharacterized protein LOC126741614 n=1 Tax=Anthonomus grandis grandis TaxID=2921223 RepID=UPI00216526C4|nr:uncharacterized protein LOC126741614 [Anthonomus grandis grandis]XP_050304077.1 uncharacterized protein LOC126741614 [Anthonomus grandis grandis]
MDPQVSMSHLERYCVQIVHETLGLNAFRSHILLQRVKKQKETIEWLQKELADTKKQYRDLNVVHNRLLGNIADDNVLVAPKITRSVGLQLERFSTDLVTPKERVVPAVVTSSGSLKRDLPETTLGPIVQIQKKRPSPTVVPNGTAIHEQKSRKLPDSVAVDAHQTESLANRGSVIDRTNPSGSSHKSIIAQRTPVGDKENVVPQPQAQTPLFNADANATTETQIARSDFQHTTPVKNLKKQRTSYTSNGTTRGRHTNRKLQRETPNPNLKPVLPKPPLNV